MRVAVVHNPQSGNGAVGGPALCARITSAGHEVVSYLSSVDSSWEESLSRDVELIVAAGGDGTVGKVLKSPVTSLSTVAIVALGTANNVARTLGVPTTQPLDAIGQWSDRYVAARYQLPRVCAGTFETYAAEGAGAGIFAELMRRADDQPATATADALFSLLGAVVQDASSDVWQVDVDGHDVSGPYLAVHATTVRETGPNIAIAGRAHLSSSSFAIVLISADDRTAVLRYAASRARGEQPLPPPFDSVAAHRVRFQAPDEVSVSIDDDVVDTTGGVTVERSRTFRRVLVPREPTYG